MRLLAIDDVPDNLVALSALLRTYLPGCDVETASSGLEGIAKARSREPDTILLDIQMPGMDGFEVCRLLKEDPLTRHVPIVFLTARNADSASRVRGLEIGGDAFLSKPVDPGELTAQVKAMVRIKQAEDRLREQASLLEELVEKRTAALHQSEARYRQLNAELELRVNERTAQLEASNRELEGFSYSVSHDLRAPLRAIDGFSGMVVERYGSQVDPEAQRLLGVVRANARKMARLIDDLLAFSRLGRSEMRYARLNMGRMAGAAFLEVAADCGRRAAIDFRLGELPDVEGDPALLEQVWIHLLSNAVKFSAGREKPVIEVEGAVAGERALYRVRDNGAGFDMAYVAKLFGVFQRLHGMKEFEGTGVGLALAQRIVVRHRGRMWAEGAVGEGATFSFELPVLAREKPGT